MTDSTVESPPDRRRLSHARRAFYVVFLLLAAVFVYWYGIRGLAFFRVPSKSMVPALAPGDFIVTLPSETYKRGDIVVLDDPLNPGDYLVKRIVAVEGDTVGISLGHLSINGRYASEPYVREVLEPINYELETLTVPPGEILVLGDNRNESEDASRWLIDPDSGTAKDATDAESDIVDGKRWKRTVPLEMVIGKVAYRYLPFGRIGPIVSFPLTNSAGE